jgi:hypothetical protein
VDTNRAILEHGEHTAFTVDALERPTQDFLEHAAQFVVLQIRESRIDLLQRIQGVKFALHELHHTEDATAWQRGQMPCNFDQFGNGTVGQSRHEI